MKNRDWLSGGENLPEILLGYHQYHDGDNEYSYRGLYRNPMLCERLAGRTGILLKQKEKQEDFVKYLPVFLKQTIDSIYIRFLTTM